MLLDVTGLKKLEIKFSGGVDEASAVTELELEDSLEQENMRVSKDGKRVEERGGLADQSLTEGEDIYGYHTYYDSSDPINFCQLLLLESQIKRKVGSGSWSSIHTFSSSIVHPQKVLEIQGKQFIINETDSRFIHTDGSDYQIGITAPTTAPALTAAAGGAMVAGIHRYAVKFCRSGNYGNESNPIKSVVGAASFTGGGENDCTSGGTYTASSDKTIRVQIDGTGTPDTIKISYDGGTTWHTETLNITTTVYLNYGVQLTFGAVTGHTATDYWDIACDAIAVTVTLNQKVQFASIPTASTPTQVDQRKIYRTTVDGSRYYWIATINDNVTTTYEDGLPDTALGDEMTEDHDVLSNGKFFVWWDNRLWVSGDNIVYYSDIENPESFDTDVRYINIIQGGEGEEITQMIDYHDSLYVFMKDCIFIIKHYEDGTYGRFLINIGFGCVAPWSLSKVNNLLMFLSHRGWELYNGKDIYSPVFDLGLTRTLGTIDLTGITSNYDYISTAHNREHGEVWMNLPDRTGGNSACTAVYNYIRHKYYVFSYHKTPSCVVEARDSNKKMQNYIGTRDGFLLLAESGYQDGGDNITSKVRKGWYDFRKHGIIRAIEVEYELPTDKTLTLNTYVDFDKDIKRTYKLTGSTPTSTDIELRRPIWDKAELGLRAKYFAFQLTNNENVAGDLKINRAFLWYAPRVLKKKTKGD